MSLFLVNEFSTFFLNANDYMAADPALKASLWYRSNGVALLASFFVARICVNSWALYHMLAVSWYELVANHGMWERVPLYVKLCAPILTTLAVGHIVINFVWFGEIVTAVKRKLGRRAHASTQPVGEGGRKKVGGKTE